MPDRYVQLPNGSYLQWPEGVSAATFKAKATKLMGQSALPVSTRGPSTMPLPAAQPPKPFMSRFGDYLEKSVEGTMGAPGDVMNRSRDVYKEGQGEGGMLGGLKMAEAPFRAEGEAIKGILKSVLGISTPGIVSRMADKEDPAKIASDATAFLGGYMAGGPKEATAGEGGSVGSVAKDITDAVNPVPKEMGEFQRSVGQHLDKIVTFAKANGINIDSLEGLAKAMKGSGDWIKNHYYNEMLGPVKDRPVSIAGTIKGYSGETASPSTATLGQLDARLSQVNAELNPKYAKGGIAAQAAVKSSAELNAEAAGIRKELYGGIAKATGLDPETVAQTRGSFGALDSLAEKTGLSASKARAAANTSAHAPLTVNPFSSESGKQFIADKAVNSFRGDVVGKQLKNSLSKVRVKPYELPKASPSAVASKVRTPLRGAANERLTSVETVPPEQAGVEQKLTRRQQANAIKERQTEAKQRVAEQRRKALRSMAERFNDE